MPLPAARKNALTHAPESLAAESPPFLGPLAGTLDVGRRAVIGWSMGGGGATQAANENPSLKAAIGLASWHLGYSPIFNRVPTLWFASFGDPLAGGQSQVFYDRTPLLTPKMLIEWTGGDHFVANDPNNRFGTVGRYGLSWLKVFLEEDVRYRQFLNDPGDARDFRSNL
jgi:pimeloyl-ACP methyl ester carboxylesterase